jgi:2-methylcitrate dehydratase PrpD
MTLTLNLGEFLQNIRFNHVPDEAVPLVIDAFTDTIGVIMAGAHEPIVSVLQKELASSASRDGVRACLSDFRLAPAQAALIGGAAAHALDYDDQALTGHPSAILVPAILAEAEVLGSSGRDMITAYMAGYEVWAELVGRGRNYHAKGWHPTSVFGVVATAAAIAVLHRLPAEQAASALAIAASHASGLSVNFGTMTKPYHAGMAARDGLISARLAARGATGSSVALEAPKGFLNAFSLDGNADLDSPSLAGKEWRILSHRLCIKRYPTCYFMHRSFDALVSLLKDNPVRPEEVADVEMRMSKGQATVLVYTHPVSGLEAKFSGQFAMAAAVILGRMGVNEVTTEVATRQDFQEFYGKVRITAIEAYDARDPAHSPSDRVKVTLKDGRVLDTGEIVQIKGHAFDPLTHDELWAKFRECTERTHSAEDARSLFDSTRRLVEITTTHDLPTATGVLAPVRLTAANA